MGGGRQVQQSTWTNGVGRLGLVAYGLLHLVLAWIAGQLAFGDGASDQASGTGALQELAQAPLGAVLVWAVAVGLAGLAAWSVLEAGWGHREFDGGKRTRKRLVSLARAPVFAVLSGAAVRVALQDSGAGSGGSSGGSGGGSSEESVTATVLSWPGGQVLVAAAGIVVVGVGVATALRGVRQSFLDDLEGRARGSELSPAYRFAGTVGHVGKGVAIAIVGGFVVYAAVTHEPEKSAGLDEALREVATEPFGQVLLLAITVGFACYGLFCFAWARHLDT